MRAARQIGAMAMAALVVAGCSSVETEAPTVSDDTVRAALAGEWTWTPQSNRLELGVTHTQNSLDPSEPTQARERGKAILTDSAAIWQNHHLMGFGTLNPEPSPDQYDWSSLDRRMQLTRETGGRTVLTLCCAPDWMKGGSPGSTDWSRIEDAPDPEHFDDFAELSALAVQRYPQIERVLVWNELKGFWHEDENRWDYESYTELYNKVYQAVKSVRPDVQVGGPYVVLSSLTPGTPDASDEVVGPWGAADQRALDVVEYWLKHNVGAEFIVVDGSSGTRQGAVAMPLDRSTQKFADLSRWLRERTPLAIWWAEFYPEIPDSERGGPTNPANAAATLAAVAAFASADVSVALLWGPQGHGLKYAALWTDSTKSNGGRPTPLTAAWKWLVPRLASRDIEIGRHATLPLLAFRDSVGDVLLVNLTGDQVRVAEGVEPIPSWGVSLSSVSR